MGVRKLRKARDYKEAVAIWKTGDNMMAIIREFGIDVEYETDVTYYYWTVSGKEVLVNNLKDNFLRNLIKAHRDHYRAYYADANGRY